MAKGSLNPAEAYRKAQRKKELKKNKTERSKARDFALVKKDTTDLEEEIQQLESSAGDKSRLVELKAELEKINQKKEEYVKEHPEQRNLVYRRRRTQTDSESKPETKLPPKRNLFNKKGLPRRPERSIYYDPVLNPYGVPPPGMPYLERPLRLDEVDSEAADNEEDAALSTSPPPGYELVQSEDGIVMPEDPPPHKDGSKPPISESPSTNFVPVPPPPMGFPVGGVPLPPPPPFMVPPGMIPGAIPPPPPPPGFPLGGPFLPPPGIPFQQGMAYPPPPPGFAAFLPPPPPGFFPRNQSMSSVQDPLSSLPHTTYQAHRANQTATRSSLPHNPSLPPKPTAAAELANATVVAAPQLRDLKKESTAFLPTSLKRKKAVENTTSSLKVNAAPSLDHSGPTTKGEDKELPSTTDARPDLVGILRDQFGPGPGPATTSGPSGEAKAASKKPDDYAKFMEEMSDVL